MVLPDSCRISRVPQYLGTSHRSRHAFVYGAFTLYGRTFQSRSTNTPICNSLTNLQLRQTCPTTPFVQRLQAYTQTVWAISFSLAATKKITVVFFSCRYWDVSLPCVGSNYPIYSDNSNQTLLWLGCPIRRSPVKRLFAPNRGLSQLTTSFIAFKCQGIRRTPLLTWLKPFNLHNLLQ